jgi:ABC-2 type transport system ATP-binding protein
MPLSPDAAIDLNHVTKIYARRIQALQDISLQVHRGEVFGLLGPNGAGKSTLIKIIMTVVRPTRAEGTILGHRVGHKPTLARVGYLPEHHRFPRYLTGRQTLEFFAALSGVDRSTRKRRSAELVETVGMTAWADKKVGEYSKGMMQRIGLAQALVNDPDLVLLDEPTDGVDPAGRRDIRQVLTRMRDLGKTVFINSHLLSELEIICDRVAILVGGRVARQGRMEDLNAAKQRYEIELVPSPIDLADSLRDLIHPGNKLATGTPIEIDQATASIRIASIDPQEIQIVLDKLRAAGLVIRSVQPVKQSLEDLYMEAIIDPATGRRSATGAALAPPPLPPAVR